MWHFQGGSGHRPRFVCFINTKIWLQGGNVCPAHARRAISVLSIVSLAPSLSSPWEVPQVDRTRPQTFSARHLV